MAGCSNRVKRDEDVEMDKVTKENAHYLGIFVDDETFTHGLLYGADNEDEESDEDFDSYRGNIKCIVTDQTGYGRNRTPPPESIAGDNSVDMMELDEEPNEETNESSAEIQLMPTFSLSIRPSSTPESCQLQPQQQLTPQESAFQIRPAVPHQIVIQHQRAIQPPLAPAVQPQAQPAPAAAPLPQYRAGIMQNDVYTAPQGGYSCTYQIWRGESGQKSHYHNLKGNPPATISDREWDLYYNRADSRIYSARGKDKSESLKARESGETRAWAIRLLKNTRKLDSDFVDSNP